MLILILFKIGITNFLSSIMLLLLSYCSVFKVQMIRTSLPLMLMQNFIS